MERFSDHQRTRIAVTGLAVALVVAGVGIGLAPGASSGPGAPSADAPRERAAPNVQAGPALVRFVHASPDSFPVNVSIGDQTVLTNVSFGNVSPYFRVVPGNYTVTVRRHSTLTESDVLLEVPLSVKPTKNYTVAIAGEVTATGDDALQTVVREDNASASGPNQTTLRLTHLSPAAPRVDVTVQETGDVLANNISYRNSSAYVNVSAGNYTLAVRQAAANDSGPVVATFNVSLSEGTDYEAYAVGYVNPEQAIKDTPFDVVVATPVVTEPSPETVITPEPEESAGTETPTEGNETAG
jgi:hypothetical protein